MLASSYGVMRETVAGIETADWGRATKLEGFKVSELLVHVLSGIDQFSRVAIGEAFDQESSVAVPAGTALQRFDVIAEESLRVWGASQAIESFYPMPWGQEQGERLAAYLVIEVTGHAWDLANGLSRELMISDELARRVLEVARSFSDETLRAPGMFGPEQPVPDDATPLVQLVAFLGREAS